MKSRLKAKRSNSAFSLALSVQRETKQKNGRIQLETSEIEEVLELFLTEKWGQILGLVQSALVGISHWILHLHLDSQVI